MLIHNNTTYRVVYDGYIVGIGWERLRLRQGCDRNGHQEKNKCLGNTKNKVYIVQMLRDIQAGVDEYDARRRQRAEALSESNGTKLEIIWKLPNITEISVLTRNWYAHTPTLCFSVPFSPSFVLSLQGKKPVINVSHDTRRAAKASTL